jgi:hypothetical protein
MKISELPEDIKKIALEYQRNEKNIHCNKETDDLNMAFEWSETKEEFNYWFKLEQSESNENKIDKNVQSVINQYKERAELGLIKYGVTTERKDIDFLGWLNHLQQELMDATIYIERLKNETNKNIS